MNDFPEEIEKTNQTPEEYDEALHQNFSPEEEKAIPSNTDQIGETTQSAETPLENWHPQNAVAPEDLSFMDQAKRAALLGIGGALIISSSFLVSQEVLDKHPITPPPTEIQRSVLFEPNKVDETRQKVEQPAAAKQESSLSQVEKTAAPAAEKNTNLEPKAAEQTKDWWLDVPVQSQHELKYQGGTTEYGCIPTSVSMVLDYWHEKDSANKTMTAQELLDVNANQGEFDGGGMSVSDTHDEVVKIGYQAEDRVNATLADLKTEVAQGPVVALVKLNMASSGYNHAVVVTGISEQNEVRVNDPWTGDSRTYSWEKFQSSWGSDFATGNSANYLVIIRPKI